MTKDQILDQLIDCEVQIQRLRAMSAELRVKLGIAARDTKKLSKHAQEAVAAAEAKPKRVLHSEAGLKAIAAAQKKRWAKLKREKKAAAKKPAAKKQQSSQESRSANIRNYWYSMTPEERSAEMARRVAKRKGGVKTLKIAHVRKAAAA